MKPTVSSIFLLSAIGAVIVAAGVAWGGSAEECKWILAQQNITEIHENTETRLAFLSIQTRESFEILKKKGDDGLEILVDEVPIKGSMRWEDFREKLTKEMSWKGLDFSYEHAFSFLRKETPPEAYDAYIKCIGKGLSVSASVDDAQMVSVQIIWNEPPGIDKSDQLMVDVREGEKMINVPERVTRERNRGNWETSFSFTRTDKFQTVSVDAEYMGNQAHINVPAEPRPHPEEWKTLTLTLGKNQEVDWHIPTPMYVATKIVVEAKVVEANDRFQLILGWDMPPESGSDRVKGTHEIDLGPVPKGNVRIHLPLPSEKFEESWHHDMNYGNRDFIEKSGKLVSGFRWTGQKEETRKGKDPWRGVIRVKEFDILYDVRVK
jgi:hypothetical protein